MIYSHIFCPDVKSSPGSVVLGIPLLKPYREHTHDSGQDGVEQTCPARQRCMQQGVCPNRRHQIQDSPAGGQDPVRPHEQGIGQRLFHPVVVHGVPGGERDLHKCRHGPHETEGKV